MNKDKVTTMEPHLTALFIVELFFGNVDTWKMLLTKSVHFLVVSVNIFRLHSSEAPSIKRVYLHYPLTRFDQRQIIIEFDV